MTDTSAVNALLSANLRPQSAAELAPFGVYAHGGGRGEPVVVTAVYSTPARAFARLADAALLLSAAGYVVEDTRGPSVLVTWPQDAADELAEKRLESFYRWQALQMRADEARAEYERLDALREGLA
ncbi:hypothetical protein SEA_MALTHUS_85 [Mycobacterium phage Malthus]|uniref:Uncharacterized protein n=1 Tax=Mycobacterium phage Malthus TaxID=2592661 RepID=A0A5Q2WM59_9CAUD|nr:hypothetical protein SEA_MALTHUS_85 [Mycobacterium phage Malthus]QTF81692.1 hypothetical protein SEA_JULIETTE_86 [Mycobacterium phage Juliette]WRQ08378.1 hypothetical protein JDBV13_00310 [Mycobacterium phage june]